VTAVEPSRTTASRTGHWDVARSARKPNVLFIVNSLEIGGAEKHVVTLLNHLDPSRFGLHLAYLKRKEQLLPQLLTGRLQDLVCCDVQRGIERRAVDRLRQVIAAKDIDVIVCTNPYSMLYGSLARTGSRPMPRLVTVFHTTLLESFKKKVQMFLYRHLFGRCDLIVYVSENQRHYWRKRGITAAPDCVIYNGIDVERFAADQLTGGAEELRHSMGFSAHDYVIGLCSVLRPEKAHGDLLQAVARMRSQGVPAKALLIGDGPERANVERQVEDLRLREHVIITGMTNDVRPYIGCCDVMALVSHSVETFSLAALESMALGKAVVMSDIGGASEQIVHGQNGFLFPAGDIPALTGHLSALSGESLRLRCGDSAAHRVRQLFTLDAMIRGFSQRIEGVVARDSPSMGLKPLRRT
jgi:glycosyltransferase involved in cell wall biosynthesis